MLPPLIIAKNPCYLFVLTNIPILPAIYAQIFYNSIFTLICTFQIIFDIMPLVAGGNINLGAKR
jgi:hypothetical protein